MTTSRRRADLDDESSEAIELKGSNDQRCTWQTNDRRCFLTRGFEVGRHRLCHWHYVTRDNPRARENFAEFEMWQNHWKGYCSEENHWTRAEVWGAICGNMDLVAVKRKRCDAALCRKVDTPIAARAESVSVRAEVKSLEAHLGAQNRPRDLAVEKQALLTLETERVEPTSPEDPVW